MRKESVTFLGALYSTFSHIAYIWLAKRHGAPVVDEHNHIEAPGNSSVLPLVMKNGGYAAIPFHTLAEGLVEDSFKSFIALISEGARRGGVGFNIIGGKKMKIRFCLMKHPDADCSEIRDVVSHKKSLGACAGRIKKLGLRGQPLENNGEAAMRVATNPEYRNYYAIGPRTAAEKYGLEIVCEPFEDKKAYTTFYLVGPREVEPKVGKMNRMLVVFDLPNVSGALYKSLAPFNRHGINLTNIESLYAGKGSNHFGIEVEVPESKIEDCMKAMKRFRKLVGRCIQFGPFEVL